MVKSNVASNVVFVSRSCHGDLESFARPDLGVSSDGPMGDQLSPLSMGDAAELTCQTSPLPDPRQLAISGVAGRHDSQPVNSTPWQLATGGVSGQAQWPIGEQYPLTSDSWQQAACQGKRSGRQDFTLFDKETAQRKEQSCHVTKPTEAI
ncbi:hypothetical protein B296_00024023 [Ensete ventricosum]|uniref:Uncharacterized protein n=1 Tax=Ensete ventricosum TaxID=4639 RepID=A0A426Z5S5_ENSVE|nr:hypothetical protein B296_00024023 [Ensete ventricosum]